MSHRECHRHHDGHDIPGSLHGLGIYVQAMEREYKAVTEQEKQEVIEVGGLHVIGTERHESRRVDNQLRGRSGRRDALQSIVLAQ